MALIERFDWIIYVFGAFLVFTGIRLALEKDKEVHPERNPVLRLMRKFVPTTKTYHGSRFFIRKMGRTFATPMLAVLVVIETTDVIFAIDSIPAILAITQDEFIVYSSNAFAILGLRGPLLRPLRHHETLSLPALRTVADPGLRGREDADL
ncbi:MAG: hypothetical protein U5K31_05385 [Balneolaceae bacterium]|nr:hypothetical protein [Balneolaceae bacterium]